jgi:replicative DNA helicase
MVTAAEHVEARYCRRIEAAAIGGLILQPGLLDDVRTWLQPRDFTVQHYGRWYALLCEMREQAKPIDQVTLLTELRHRRDLGPDGRHAVELATITERVPIPGDPRYYALAVLEESVRRDIAAAGVRLGSIAHDGEPETMFDAVLRVQLNLNDVRSNWDVAAGADVNLGRPPVERG